MVKISPKIQNHMKSFKYLFSAPVNGLKRAHGPLNFSLPHPGRHPAAAYPQQHYKVDITVITMVVTMVTIMVVIVVITMASVHLIL